ncbi:MAG: DUF3015 family protein [Marinagarivorans sp.]|nr:DUF3015 family protein [Marinagarivorans sp.]
MKNTIKLVTSIALLTISAGSFAADKATKPTGSGPNPFSDCGIGAALFPNTPAGAVISNIIWDVGTTAVTSATASPETCSGKNVKAAAFIYETYDSLVEDTARGEGDHLSTLLEILDLEGSQKDSVAASIRAELATLVSADDYAKKSQLEKANDLYNILSVAG